MTPTRRDVAESLFANTKPAVPPPAMMMSKVDSENDAGSTDCDKAKQVLVIATARAAFMKWRNLMVEIWANNGSTTASYTRIAIVT